MARKRHTFPEFSAGASQCFLWPRIKIQSGYSLNCLDFHLKIIDPFIWSITIISYKTLMSTHMWGSLCSWWTITLTLHSSSYRYKGTLKCSGSTKEEVRARISEFLLWKRSYLRLWAFAAVIPLLKIYHTEKPTQVWKCPQCKIIQYRLYGIVKD